LSRFDALRRRAAARTVIDHEWQGLGNCAFLGDKPALAQSLGGAEVGHPANEHIVEPGPIVFGHVSLACIVFKQRDCPALLAGLQTLISDAGAKREFEQVLRGVQPDWHEHCLATDAHHGSFLPLGRLNWRPFLCF
jgi:hypothetical protein